VSTEIEHHPEPYPFIPRQAPSPAYTEGAIDAVDSPRWILAARIAAAYDEANATGGLPVKRWADEYAAGALSTWAAIDRLNAALDTFGAK